VIVIDSEASANVQVLQIEALLTDHADEFHHQHRRIPEDVHLQAGEPLLRLWHSKTVIAPRLVSLSHRSSRRVPCQHSPGSFQCVRYWTKSRTATVAQCFAGLKAEGTRRRVDACFCG